MSTTTSDDYRRIAEKIVAVDERDDAMRLVVDCLWDEPNGRDVSWLGFYIDHPNEPDDRRLVLGSHRDKPACSPIGMHGVCGRALVTGSAQIVRDVSTLGENYVACDPRDRAELVVPLFDGERCWGVLDLDSHTVGRFSDEDCAGCRNVLIAAGFQTDKTF